MHLWPLGLFLSSCATFLWFLFQNLYTWIISQYYVQGSTFLFLFFFNFIFYFLQGSILTSSHHVIQDNYGIFQTSTMTQNFYAIFWISFEAPECTCRFWLPISNYVLCRKQIGFFLIHSSFIHETIFNLCGISPNTKCTLTIIWDVPQQLANATNIILSSLHCVLCWDVVVFDNIL